MNITSFLLEKAILLYNDLPVLFRRIFLFKKCVVEKFHKILTVKMIPISTRAGHSLLFSVFALCYSATLTPLFDITTPLLFRNIYYTGIRNSISLLLIS
jgi:hypothetical protein